MYSLPQVWNKIIADNQSRKKTEKSESSFTWRSMEGDCNAYALIAVNVSIMRMVYWEVVWIKI